MTGPRVFAHRGAGPLLAAVVAIAVACVACAFAVGLGRASAAPAPPATYYGANVQPIFEKGFVAPSAWNGLIAAMSADSLRVARMDAAWSWVEPTAPVNGVHTYDWDPPADPTHSMDKLVALLASNGVRMLAVLAIPPAWAGTRGQEMVAAHDGDFVAYAAAFAARYGANGSFWKEHAELPYLPVQQLEIWTEANSTNFWTGSPDPPEYVKVLELLSPAVHAVDPSAQVLASIGWQNAAAYVSQLYSLGVKGSIDALGYHPYAPDVPSTVGLIQQMRATLAAAGDPDLPIDDTETGEPAPPNTPADATRAAMLPLVGDALAHSDCNVQSFDVYALTGSDTGAEPINEGYMGILNDTTGAPNLTGQALIAASRRWQADPGSGLSLCGGAPAGGSLLPLGLSLTHTSPTCVSATITYYGNPLQSAQIVLRTADGRVDPAGTSPSGQTQMCLQDGPAISSFTVYAEISSPVTTASFANPNIAESPTYRCPVSVSAPTAACTLVTPAAAGPGTSTSTSDTTQQSTTTTATTTTTLTSVTSSPAARSSGEGSRRTGRGGASATGVITVPGATAVSRLSGCALHLALVSVARRRGRTTLRARLICGSARQPTAHLLVALLRGRSRRATASVVLAGGRWRTLSLAVTPRTGDRITARVIADPAAGVPAITTALAMTPRARTARKRQ